MRNQDMPAMPTLIHPSNRSGTASSSDSPYEAIGGLTKLEHFAGLAMAELAAPMSDNGRYLGSGFAPDTANRIAEASVRCAKALLEELEKAQ